MQPIEIADPEFAGLIAGAIEHNKNADSKIIVRGEKVYHISGRTCTEMLGELPGRNDPCICGSGKKYKKCCANQ